MNDTTDISSDQEKPSTEADKISALLSAGESAKIRLYHTLLGKIASGESLSTAELKNFSTLHDELKNGLLSDSKPSDITFKSPLAVFKYLENAGYKLGQAQVYRHVNAGKLRPNKDGKFSLQSVEKYAAMYLKFKDGTTPAMAEFQEQTVFDDLQRRKLEAETNKAVQQAEHWRRRNIDLDSELSARLDQKLSEQSIILKADLRNLSYSKSPAIIDLVKGDHETTVDLIAFLNDLFDQHLARYTKEALND